MKKYGKMSVKFFSILISLLFWRRGNLEIKLLKSENGFKKNLHKPALRELMVTAEGAE